MTSGRKRRARDRRRRARPPEAPAEGRRPPEDEGNAGQPEEEEAPRRPWGRLSRGVMASPLPPAGPTLARGFVSVGSSPLILGTAFLGTLAIWGAFVLVGRPPSPQESVSLVALPPLHLTIDVGAILSVPRPTVEALSVVIGLGIVRALVLAALGLLVADAIRGDPLEVRAVLQRVPRVAMSMFGLYGAELGLLLIALLLLQAFLGPAALVIVLLLGLHFLAFAPSVVAAEQAPAGLALRLAVRAARLPGVRHLAFISVYFLAVLYASLLAPGGAVSPATPSMLVWVFTLVATFVHVSILAGLTFRWLAIRDEVLAAAAAAAKARARDRNRRGRSSRGARRSGC